MVVNSTISELQKWQTPIFGEALDFLITAQREFKEVDISQWGKKLKKFDHLRFKNAFYNSFGSESKFIESENKNSLWQIVWLLEVGEGMEISHFTF